MQAELKIIEKEGAMTSLEMKEVLDKSLQAIIRQLNSLENLGQIKIIEFQTKTFRKRLYLKNEIFNNICKIA